MSLPAAAEPPLRRDDGAPSNDASRLSIARRFASSTSSSFSSSSSSSIRFSSSAPVAWLPKGFLHSDEENARRGKTPPFPVFPPSPLFSQGNFHHPFSTPTLFIYLKPPADVPKTQPYFQESQKPRFQHPTLYQMSYRQSPGFPPLPTSLTEFYPRQSLSSIPYHPFTPSTSSPAAGFINELYKTAPKENVVEIPLAR